MSLLEMPSAELLQKIESELAKNPALELIDERLCPSCNRKLIHPGPCPVCSRPKDTNADQPIVLLSSTRDQYPQSARISTSNELPNDNFAPAVEDLPTYVFRQIATEIQQEDQLITAHILASLDDDGLLIIEPIEISRYHHVPLSRVENILKLIHRADPVGVGAPSPLQALLIQLEVLADTKTVPALAERAIKEGLNYLSRHQYDQLACLLDISPDEAHSLSKFISENLNPYPGRAHWGEIQQPGRGTAQIYYHPDIHIHPLDPRKEIPLVVEIFIPMRGSLRVNPLFRKSISDASPNKIGKWKNNLDQAQLFIKCLQQRNNTMRRLMSHLTILQRDFILRGDLYLHPMTRTKVAEELGVHESTISRAVSDKTVQLPNGRIIPLERFFDRSLHIRAAMKRIIETEEDVLTDSKIAEQLAELDYPIARRTVAKYRSMEGILPARLRRNNKNNEQQS
jgi:RNA polymerase sigma-54 factor